MKSASVFLRGSFVALATLIAGGCSGDPREEPVGRTQGELMTATAWWSQGQAPVNLGPSSDRFCFLTYVTGKFEGGGESVRLQIVNGQWQLTGSSSQTGVAAGARCQLNVAATDQTAEAYWVQGQRAINLGSANNRACFLTGVQGKFAGAGEAVQVQKAGEYYFLGGQSQQAGVGARARCVLNRTTFTNDWNWSQGQAATVMVQAFTENNGWACGLTRMTGRFQGAGEVIRIDWDTVERRLWGASNQSGVAASANCF